MGCIDQWSVDQERNLADICQKLKFGYGEATLLHSQRLEASRNQGYRHATHLATSKMNQFAEVVWGLIEIFRMFFKERPTP